MYTGTGDGPGKAETERLCKNCHEVNKSVSPRQDRTDWEATLTKMVATGMKAPQKDLEAIPEYLVANYPAREVPPVNLNKAEAIVRYRDANGPFR